MADQQPIRDWLVERIAALAGLPAEQVPTDEAFTELGLSSLQAVELSEDLRLRAGVELEPTAAYDHPTIDAIAAHVAGLLDRAANPAAARPPAQAAPPTAAPPHAVEPAASGAPVPVAIVGIGCRVPGADGPGEFWRLLLAGTDAVGEVPANRWDADAYYDPDKDVPGRMNTRWGGFLSDVEGFDADFFGVSPREAARMDPQQRLALETAWEALEDAGVPASDLAGSRTGVYMGASTFDHGTALWGTLEGAQPYDGTGGALSIVANRISYILDLRGPSMVVDTACSSSLVAVHTACQALRDGAADLALAGGVNVITSPRIALSFSQGGLMAADGRCKPFDHRADGYVRSEGVGVIVLKPLPRAVADGDRIYAVIRGGAVNQDGRTNGLTAPGGPSQEAVLRAACRSAGLSGAHIGYVEAHGTGTAVGDRIEVAALAKVLGEGRPADRPLRIGSVKSNVGHLEAAAGVTGLIKTALSLYHRRLPPTVHFEKPNPLLDLDRIPVAVVADAQEWPLRPDGTPAPAGVSSFGFGGTNSHLVLAAGPSATAEREGGAATAARPPLPLPGTPPPAGGHAGDNPRPLLVPLSARSEQALRERAAAWSAAARAHAGDRDWVRHAAAAAALRVDHAPYRAAVVAAEGGELADAMAALAAGETAGAAAGPGPAARRAPKVALVFPGQGSQWPGMGRRLAATEPVFREAIREADAAVARHLGRSLWSDEHGLVVEGTAAVQPALFATQVALAATWRAWGLDVCGVIGHSMGEIAAAHAAGALSLDDAARVVCERSRLLTGISGRGGLALVELSADEAAGLVAGREHELSVAALNGPRATVLSGTPAALEDVLATLAARGVFARRIAVEFAAHSPQVEPFQPRLREALAGLRPRDADIELYSTVTGATVRGRELGPGYWATNVRATVRFHPALELLAAAGYDAFVEIAPHPVLARPVADLLEEHGRPDALVVSSLRRGEDETRHLLGALGTLYTAGSPVHWPALYPGGAAHVPTPPHGWRRRHFPIARLDGPRAPAAPPAAPGSLLGPRIPVGVEPSLKLWQVAVGHERTPELLDHVVEDVPVVAGAYWLTAAAQAAAELSGGEPVVLRDVGFSQPYALREGQEDVVQLSVRPGADGRERFTVTSCPPHGRPTTHAHGVVGGAADRTPPGDGLAAITARCATAKPVDAQYALLEGAGLRYGPRFRALRELYAADGEALARFRLPEGLPAAAPPLHPALLDSCLHTVSAATGRVGREGSLPLPVGADLVRAESAGPALTEGWCHARVREADDRTITADVTVFDTEGVPVWSATGFRVRMTRPRRRPEDGRVYDVRWQPYEPGAPAADCGDWLVLADDERLSAALGSLVTRSGGRVVAVSGRRAGARGAQAARYEPLLDRARAAAGGELRGVIDARAVVPEPSVRQEESDGRGQDAGRAVHAPESADPVAQLRLRAQDALGLAKAVAGHAWEAAAPRLWLLTTGTQAQPGPSDPRAPAAAVLWGLGRVFSNEFPESGCTLVDLDRAAPDADLAPLGAALRAAEPPQQVAVRDGRLFAPVLAEAPRAPAARPPAVRADRTYVLTGGLGALGLRVARHLVENGARRLLLLGRGAPSAEAARRIAELTAAGCEVRTAQADAADREQVRAALSGPGTRVPIGGVVHLAGVLEDALLPDLTGDALDRALAGKAAGAWHLHELTRDEPVEMFVLFSSLAGIIGSPGQGAYAAANAFLDALARRRAAAGLPAQSLDWGPWAGDTLAAAGGDLDRLAARGVPPLDPDTAIALFDEALRGGRPHLVVSAFAPAGLAGAGGWSAARGLLAPLLPGAGPAGAGQGPSAAAGRGTVRARIAALGSEPERRHAMLGFLTEQVRQVLGAREGAVQADVPFQSLGFDSLMAIELRGRLEAALDLKLSATLVYAHPTADALTEQLLTRLGPGPSGTPAPGTAGTAPAPGTPGPAPAPGPVPDGGHTPAGPEDDLAGLDDAEVAALLAAELDALDADGKETR
ncbi:type I polyketide synthase [Streptomyces sp. HPF1205]|uniref:type I polyketide synthase n=1 Tax=Streptomyces sp. HPF1205 TaxID=2873262 RepID=UPI001CED25DD|nr:type I polyketide synthase [Streptomyces sp. HPF1205]